MSITLILIGTNVASAVVAAVATFLFLRRNSQKQALLNDTITKLQK